ncbi:hypothetical protein ES705_17549 [subsurface metagenome]
MRKLNRSYEDLDIAIGLEPQELASTNVTGPFYDMAEYREALCVLNAGNITAGGTSKIEVMEATGSTGADAQALTSFAATIAANVKVKALTCTCTTGTAGDDISFVIDGTTYTYTAADGGASSGGEFSTTGSTTVTATNILACIDDGTLGFDTDKAFATSASNVVTVEAHDGYYLDSIAQTGAFMTPATTKANAYVWLDSMNLTADYPYIACKVTTDSNTGDCSAVIIRGKSKDAIEQKVGAQYPA